MLKLEQFMKGPVRVPWPVRGDAYTVSSMKLVSDKAKERSVYNFTNRRSPVEGFPQGVARDGRMVLYGLTDFIQRELTRPVDLLDIGISHAFMSDAHALTGGPLDFDTSMWRRVVGEYNGYLPIRIEALPECSTFWANEPVIQVTSLERGFGEIAAIIEAVLVGMVSNATARLTLTRHLLERIRETVRRYNPAYTKEEVDSVAQNMVHDFGMRASSTPQESEIYGRTSLLCFNTTDTFNAAFQAWAADAARPVGTSILALAHRIVQGYDREEDAYEAMLGATKDSAGSYVADCYDFHNAVRKFLVNIAKRGESTVVARPDSGDYMRDVVFVVEQALAAELYKPDVTGRPMSTTLRFIQGDSMNWEKINKVMHALERMEVNPTGWGAFGIGGWLRNTGNRDTLSSAYKLSAVGVYDQPVVKLSETESKMSVPGPNMVYRPVPGKMMHGASTFFYEEDPPSLSIIVGYRTYYDALNIEEGGTPFTNWCLEDFNDHRKRCLEDFDSYAYVPQNRGNPLSPQIQQFQQERMRKSGKSSASLV